MALTLAALLHGQCMAATSAADEVFLHPQNTQQLLAGPLAAPTSTLRSTNVVRGNFVFRRYLRELPQPLVSRGIFSYVRDLGMDWHTRQPIDSQFVVTADSLTQLDDGKVSSRLKASKQPAIKMVADIFLSLMSLDVASLQKTFRLYGSQQNGQWKLGLRPRSAAASKVFKEALVIGRAQVESVELSDSSGDRTLISFSAVTTDTAPNAVERAVFELSEP